MFSGPNWTKKGLSKWKLENLASQESCFRHSNYRHEQNNMLKLEAYNLLWNRKQTILQSLKTRFKLFWSDLSVKTCANDQLNTAVLKRSRQRFRALNDVFRAKLNELSAMIYCNHGPKRDLVNWNWRTYQVGNHVFGAQTILTSKITCWNEKLTTCFETEKKRSYNYQNRVLSAVMQFERKNMLKSTIKNCILKSI